MSNSQRRLIVMHRAPDLDAISSAWLLQRFDAQNHLPVQYAFVEAGERLSEAEAERLGFSLSQVTHVDTGLGRFDHHDPIKGQQYTAAIEQVYFYLIEIHPELADNKVLPVIIDHVKQIDHFKDVNWPEPANHRYLFMLHEIIRGMDFTMQNDDQSQVVFGFQALDFIYAATEHTLKAEEIIEMEGQEFALKAGPALAIETRNDETIRIAQKQGYLLAVRKDPETGHARIKARPDAPFDLKAIYDEILVKDQTGRWFYHPSGKMVLNGSSKTPSHQATPLTLTQLVEIIKHNLS